MGMEIGKVAAIDDDISLEFRRTVFRIDDQSAARVFQISESGCIWIASDIDFEQNRSFQFFVEAIDKNFVKANDVQWDLASVFVEIIDQVSN